MLACPVASVTEFTLSPADWETVGVFMALLLFTVGFNMFGGGR